MKEVKIKNKPDGAKGQSCINCGVNDGTVVSAHYTGMRGYSFGKGVATKASDLCVADLCMKCHAAFDQYTMVTDSTSSSDFQKKIDLSEQFMFAILNTLHRRIEDKIISVKGNKNYD